MSKNGRSVREKGRRGEAEFALILESRGWFVIPLGPGREQEDRFVMDPTGRHYALEVKTRKVIDLPAFTAQARDQAKRRKCSWMVAAKIHGTSSWLVARQGERPSVWHAREGCEP